MNAHDENRSSNCSSSRCRLLMPDAEPSRDLWPAVLRRLDAAPAAATPGAAPPELV